MVEMETHHREFKANDNSMRALAAHILSYNTSGFYAKARKAAKFSATAIARPTPSQVGRMMAYLDKAPEGDLVRFINHFNLLNPKHGR